MLNFTSFKKKKTSIIEHYCFVFDPMGSYSIPTTIVETFVTTRHCGPSDGVPIQMRFARGAVALGSLD
jgi:hypothetical protein